MDITGPGFTVSREELSGDGALELAMMAIDRGELDAAIVGAVDLSDEQVHAAAISKVHPQSSLVADAAVLLVLKSLAQAQTDGDQILAVIEAGQGAGDFDDRPPSQCTGSIGLGLGQSCLVAG